jgi:hypothetical protein
MEPTPYRILHEVWRLLDEPFDNGVLSTEWQLATTNKPGDLLSEIFIL